MQRSIVRLIAVSLLWLILTQGRVESWPVAVPTIIAAVIAAHRLGALRGWRLSPIGLARFVLHFLVSSFVGGLDVAARSVHPRLPIEPGIVEYPMQLPAGTARTLFIGVVNLIPGTVSADVRGNVLLVHTIDTKQPNNNRLRRLEERIAALFVLPTHDQPQGERS